MGFGTSLIIPLVTIDLTNIIIVKISMIDCKFFNLTSIIIQMSDVDVVVAVLLGLAVAAAAAAAGAGCWCLCFWGCLCCCW